MIERVGGDASFQPDTASEPVSWETIRDYDPEVLVVAPCGFERDRAIDAVDDLRDHEGWADVTAVKNGDVYAVGGNALFNRPSHRLVESLVVLQWCIHTDAIELSDDSRSYVQQLDSPQRPPM